MTRKRPAIDHLVLAWQDLEAARAQYRRIGFTLTPPARHPFGTGNSLAQLQGNFLELLSVVEPEKLVPMGESRFSFGAFNADFLKRREGLSMLVLTSDDALADNEAWAARGLATFEPLHFSRQAKQPDGGSATVSFSLAFAIDPAMPEAAFFVCQQHNPEAFWQPNYQQHENGAHQIVGATLLAETPEAHRAFFERMVSPEALQSLDGGFEVALEGGRIEVLSESVLGRRFASDARIDGQRGAAFVATTIAVADLKAVSRLLASNGVPFAERSEAIEVPPSEAGGTLLEFVPVA